MVFIFSISGGKKKEEKYLSQCGREEAGDFKKEE